MSSIVLYRGESGDSDDLSSLRGSLTFTTNQAVALEYARSPLNNATACRPRLIKARITYQKAWVPEGFSAWLELADIIKRLGRDEAVRIALKFETRIYDTNCWEELSVASGIIRLKEFIEADESNLSKLYFRAFPFFDCPEEIGKLKALGYDCAIMQLMPEFRGGYEYRVFDPAMVNILSVSPVKESK